MADIAERFSAAFRDYAVSGLPASGVHEPNKREIRAIGPALDGALAALLAAFVADDATLIYAVRSSLFSNLTPGPGAIGIVYNDGPRNGVYIKVGASGSGSWATTGLMLQGQKGDDGRSVYESALATGFVAPGTTERQFLEQIAGVLASQATVLTQQYRDQAQSSAAAAAASAQGAASQIDLVAGIRNTLFNVRGNWAAATAYAARDIVTNNGIAYFAVSAHTSAAAFNTDLIAGRWAIYQAVPDGDLVVNSQTSRPKVPARVDAGVANEVTLNGAINQLASYDGGVVRVAEGTMTVSNPVQLKGNIKLQGAIGGGSKLRMANGVNKNVIEINGTRQNRAKRAVIADLEIDGNKANNVNGTDGSAFTVGLDLIDRYWTGVRVKFADHVLIERCFIHDCSSNGVQVEDGSYFRMEDSESSDCNFNGLFLVNDSKHAKIIGNHLHRNGDNGSSCERIGYTTGNEDRAAPTDGSGPDYPIFMHNHVYDNGGPKGYSPRETIHDIGLGGLDASNQTYIGNVVLRTIGVQGTGIYTKPGTAGHIIIGNTVLDSSYVDLSLGDPNLIAYANLFRTTMNAVNRAIGAGPYAVATKQNIDDEGYTSEDFLDSDGMRALTIGHGNPAVGAQGLRGKQYLSARNELLLLVGDAIAGGIRPGGLMSLTGRLSIGTLEATSPLQVSGLPIYADNAAAKAAGLTAGAVYIASAADQAGVLKIVF